MKSESFIVSSLAHYLEIGKKTGFIDRITIAQIREWIMGDADIAGQCTQEDIHALLTSHWTIEVQITKKGEVFGCSDIEDPAVQSRLLTLNEQRMQEDQQTAAFYDLMAEDQ